MTKGSNNFPKTIVELVQLLNDYKVPTRHQHNQEHKCNDVAFIQGNGRCLAPKSKIECWHCSKKGQYKKNKSPELQVLEVGIQNLLLSDKWELDMGVQILHVNKLDKPAKDSWMMVQTKREMTGVRNILSPYHVYINTCTIAMLAPRTLRSCVT